MKLSFLKAGEKLRRIDGLFVNAIQMRSNLLIALIVVTLCIWGSSTGHVWFVAGIMVVGALSYFFGIVVALLGGLAFTSVELFAAAVPHMQASVIFMEITGYVMITWLGYRHKEQKELQQEHIQQKQQFVSHSAQVIPWSVTNEVRTSLAAVRFLLFPLDIDEQTDPTLEKATAELSRLEHLFKEMEQDKLKEANQEKTIH